MTCEILIHRDGTTCPDAATAVVINRVAYRPTRVLCCARHADRFSDTYWRREPYPGSETPTPTTRHG